MSLNLLVAEKFLWLWDELNDSGSHHLVYRKAHSLTFNNSYQNLGFQIKGFKGFFFFSSCYKAAEKYFLGINMFFSGFGKLIHRKMYIACKNLKKNIRTFKLYLILKAILLIKNDLHRNKRFFSIYSFLTTEWWM